ASRLRPPPLPPTALRARAASDAFLMASGYAMRRCEDCDAVVKIPPSIQSRVTACPRCKGRLRPAGE
ncbi:MAG: hypothetical protein O2894_13020, partial [Planctomycetota bacterium]|nr:hypothetical protein [Planctomycetota bacterium]